MPVGDRQVFRISRGAYPAEWSEAVIEEERSHDVLHIRRVTEPAVGVENISPGPCRFQQECIAVVEEIHPFGSYPVDGGHLPAQRCLHGFPELRGSLTISSFDSSKVRPAG